MKHLLLFDIDGTLTRDGPAKGAFEDALVEVFGTSGPIEGHDFSGKTDPQIARELMRGAGLADEEILKGLPDLWKKYLEGLEPRLKTLPMTILPGVRETLDHLAALDGVALGLLTGNLIEGARLKLESVRLMKYFAVGGYGSDSEIREDLPAVAIGRANEYWGVKFNPDSVVVVGDTPRDVACGLYGGTRTVGVTTGRFDEKALLEAGAHHVLSGMQNVSEAVAAFLG